MSNKPETLVIFSPAFPKDEEDTEWLPWLQLIVRSINKNFPSLNIIVFAFQYPHHNNTYQWNNNKVIAFSGMNRGKFSRLYMWLRIIKEFYALKRKYHVKGIFSMWCGECTLLAKLCSKLFGTRFYCWVLGGDARPSNQFIKWIQPKPDELVAMSDFLVEQFYKSHGIKPAHIITNAVEPAMYNMMPAERTIDIIGAGGLSFLKRYEILVEVVAALKKHIPNIRAVLCGSGEETGDIIKGMIKDLALEENMEMPGFVKHKDVIEKMQHAKILLHPSSYEGFSSVCLEAIYAGAHVISFIKPMHYDIKNWHIVQTKEEMMAKALQLLTGTFIPERVLVKTMDDISKEIVNMFNAGS